MEMFNASATAWVIHIIMETWLIMILLGCLVGDISAWMIGKTFFSGR